MHVFFVFFAFLLAARLLIYFMSEESQSRTPGEPMKWIGKSGKTYASFADKFNNKD